MNCMRPIFKVSLMITKQIKIIKKKTMRIIKKSNQNKKSNNKNSKLNKIKKSFIQKMEMLMNKPRILKEMNM